MKTKVVAVLEPVFQVLFAVVSSALSVMVTPLIAAAHALR